MCPCIVWQNHLCLHAVSSLRKKIVISSTTSFLWLFCKFCCNSLQWWLYFLTASASWSSNKSREVHLFFCKNTPTKFQPITQSLSHALPVTQKSLEVHASTLDASMGTRKVLDKGCSHFPLGPVAFTTQPIRGGSLDEWIYIHFTYSNYRL